MGNKVWLSLGRYIKTRRLSKKLDWKNAKYTVIQVVDNHTVKLNTPPGPHNVYHIDRLRLAASDPLSSQEDNDLQPKPIVVNGQEESIVEEIIAEAKRRRGGGTSLWYEVKWVGYAVTTWEPAINLEDNASLDRWEELTKGYRDHSGALPKGFRRDNPQFFSGEGV